MLCNEGHRQALRTRKERDRMRRREYRADLLHPLFYTFLPRHILLPDQDHLDLQFDLLTCPIGNPETRRSLPDLTKLQHNLNFDLHSEKRRTKDQRILDEIKWKEEDYQSDLEEPNRERIDRDPVEIYRRACERYRVRLLNEVIEGLTTTLKFNLTEMSITDLDLQVICLAARDMSRNSIRTEGLEILASLFLHDEMSTMKIFHVASCDLIDADGSILKKIIQGGDMLEELDLSGNDFGPLTCKSLGSALKDAHQLKRLDLSWNRIRDDDIRPICKSLKNHPSLERLNLKMNGLANAGAILFAQILPFNQSLIDVDLSDNRIEHDGASIFASKLEQNFYLKRLSFGNNPIGTLGSLVLLKAIDHVRSQVEYLNLQNVLINDDFLDLYTQINQYLRPLEVIHGGIRGRLGREHPKVPGFTLMDDLDLKSLDTKSLHALFQRDPFKILGRIVEEGGYDFIKALQKWDLEEHGSLTYSIYVIDFPSAVRDAGIPLDKTMQFILWNYLKKIEKKGSVSYVQFIGPPSKVKKR